MNQNEEINACIACVILLYNAAGEQWFSLFTSGSTVKWFWIEVMRLNKEIYKHKTSIPNIVQFIFFK